MCPLDVFDKYASSNQLQRNCIRLGSNMPNVLVGLGGGVGERGSGGAGSSSEALLFSSSSSEQGVGDRGGSSMPTREEGYNKNNDNENDNVVIQPQLLQSLSTDGGKRTMKTTQ